MKTFTKIALGLAVLGIQAKAFVAGTYSCIMATLPTEKFDLELHMELQKSGKAEFLHVNKTGLGKKAKKGGYHSTGKWQNKGNKAKIFTEQETGIMYTNTLIKSKGKIWMSYVGDTKKFPCKKVR